MKYLLTIILGVLLLSGLAHATTYNASTCSVSDVQTALNSVSQTSDIVIVPAGNCTWTTSATIPCFAFTFQTTGTPNSQGANTGAPVITVNSFNLWS